MLKKILITTLLASVLGVEAFAYDAEKAKYFDAFYSKFTPKVMAHSSITVEADDVMKMIRENAKFTFLDIRTPAEIAILGLNSPNTLEIPLHEVFKEANLKKLPTDEKIIIVCRSDSRATMLVSSLVMLGFSNVIILKGGIVDLAGAVGTGTVTIK